jgi:transcriptional regulator with XRE-family HTH domain
MEQQPERPSQTLARHLRYWRKERDLSAQALANRLAEMGAPTLNRRVISKIENGDRGVTLDEWLQLAHALAVPPPLLFLDLKSGSDVMIAGGVIVHPWLAWEWVVGEQAPVMTDHTITRVEEFSQAKQALMLYRREVKAANAVINAESDIAAAEYAKDREALRAARAQHAEALRGLARCLDDMVENDMEPPAQPRARVDTMRSLKALKYPDRVQVHELRGSNDGR